MITLSVGVRNRRLVAIAQELDAAVSGARLQIYSGNRPLPGSTITDQILLVECRLAKPAVSKIEGGVMQLSPLPEALCRRSGEATWARLNDGDGRWVMEMDVGQIDSDAEVQLTSLELFAGGAVAIIMAEIRE